MNCTLLRHAFSAAELRGGEWKTPYSGCFTSGEGTWYPLNRRPCGLQGQYGRFGERYFLRWLENEVRFVNLLGYSLFLVDFLNNNIRQLNCSSTLWHFPIIFTYPCVQATSYYRGYQGETRNDYLVYKYRKIYVSLLLRQLLEAMFGTPVILRAVGSPSTSSQIMPRS
jgi:hypothetical protein